MSNDCLAFTEGMYGNRQAKTVQFQIMRGRTLRVTSEYTLVFIPEINEWLGDVIAYGHWWDLEPDEVDQLRQAYSLDELMQDYLERGGE